MKKKFSCNICEQALKDEEELCATCKNHLYIYEYELICNCDEEHCMTLCRDCIMNSENKIKWKHYLRQNKLKSEI